MIRLGQCTANPNHWYSGHAPECPWCKVLDDQGVDHFPGPGGFQGNISNCVYREPVLTDVMAQPATGQVHIKHFPDWKIAAILIIAVAAVIGVVILSLPALHTQTVVSSPMVQTVAPPRTEFTVVPTQLGNDAKVTLPYHESIALAYGLKTRSFTSTQAPITIVFDTIPEKITDVKVIFRSESDMQGTEKEITRNDENAYVVITVRDGETGRIIAEDGFGKQYSSETHKEIKILKSGSYQLEISGARASVSLSITS
jgi:hypothetical protein